MLFKANAVVELVAMPKRLAAAAAPDDWLNFVLVEYILWAADVLDFVSLPPALLIVEFEFSSSFLNLNLGSLSKF
jgi:hypothetical protein